MASPAAAWALEAISVSVSVRSVALKSAQRNAAALALQQVQASPKTAVAALASLGTKHWAARLNAGSLLASDALAKNK